MKRPVTILGGFLGSGKTTLLNRLLKSDHGLRIALMINDFGDVNIDKDLVIGVQGDVMELSGGCMCCTIRDDLLATATDLVASGRNFDYVIVETSGVADPATVAQTFLVPSLEAHFRLDGVVVVVDSANVGRTLAGSDTARTQIAAADLLVVNKLDLIDPQDIDRVKALLASINPGARMLPSMHGMVAPALLLDIDAHRPAPARPARKGLRADAAMDVVQSASFDEPVELDYDLFHAFLQALPDSIYRAKGIVAIRGFRRRVTFHRVGYRNVLDQDTLWQAEPRSSRAVFLGNGFDGDALLAALRACAADGTAQRAA